MTHLLIDIGIRASILIAAVAVALRLYGDRPPRGTSCGPLPWPACCCSLSSPRRFHAGRSRSSRRRRKRKSRRTLVWILAGRIARPRI